MRILMRYFLITLIGFGLHFVSWRYLTAGTTGKIAGSVKDRETREALIGANIQVEGTYLGSAADIKGNYYILSVPPGKYTLLITMMGYQVLKIQKVAVSVDQTTRLDIAMVQEVLQSSKAVEIIAERPIIQKDLTTSIEVLTMERFEQSTATSVTEAVNLQTGVFFDPIPVEGNLSGLGRGEARDSIRGGEQDEVLWYIDGARTVANIEATADAGGSFTNINRESVQEIQVITGGFNAEYGQAQSGIVNVITKEGGQKFTGSLDYQYSPPHQRHFGTYLYDQDKNYEFLIHTLPDGKLDPRWWTPERARQVYDYRKIPDHALRFSLGGPVPGRFLPLLGSQIKKMTFFLSGQYKEQAYPFPRPRDSRKMTNISLSGNYTVLPGLTIKFGGLYNQDAHSTNREESYPYNAKYYRGYGSLLDNDTYQARLGIIHTISSNLYYEVKLSSYILKINETPSPYRVPGESKKPDVWGWHYYADFEDENFISHLFSPVTHNVLKDHSLTGNLNWQANQTNFIKVGFEFHAHTFQEDSWILPSDSDDLKNWRVRGLNETCHPLQFGIYLQDILEFESMILNIGLRYNLFDGNRKYFTRESFIWNPAIDPAYDPKQDLDRDGIDALGNKKWDFQNVLQQPREWVKPQHSFNPRLGISFPISNQTVFHFSYGHFYQIPPINSQFEFVYFRPESIIKGASATDSDPERVINMTLEPGYAGFAPLFTSSAKGGLKQPATIFYAQTIGNSQYFTSASQTVANLYAILSGANQTWQAPAGEVLSPLMLADFGPYDLAPGDWIRIVIVEAVNGIPQDLALKGLNSQSKLSAGLDSLKNTVTRAKQLFDQNYQPTTLAPPAPAVEHFVLPSTQGIALTWSPDLENWIDPLKNEADLKIYRVYRSERAYIGPFTRLREIRIDRTTDRSRYFDSELGKWKYKDNAIQVGFGYFYAVTAVDADGNESGMTNRNTTALVPARRPSENALNVKVFPNPFRLVSGLPTAGEETSIIFTNLPEICTIRIYTINGELVRKLEHQNPNSGEEVWNQLIDARKKQPPASISGRSNRQSARHGERLS